jgi:hypothetical protein
MIDVGALYEVAARAGLLAQAQVEGRAVPVDFRAPDVVLLDGLVLSHQYTMTYPAAWLPQLGVGSTVDIGGQSYRVREITAIGDGSEQRATLTRV